MIDQPPHGPTFRLTKVAGIALGVTVLLLLHRYLGIYHDSILYLGQGLVSRWPDVYGADLFFQHGSQTDYSLLPFLLGQAFGIWSPPTVFLWGTLLSLLLFAAASWYCLRSLLPETARYWAWLAVLCLPGMYGVVHIFSYNEKFLTARPLAETLCLFAVGLITRRRLAAGAAALAFAALFHPLQAIGAAAVIWSWLVVQDRRWLHAAWLVLPVMALGVAGVAPFDGLFRRADPEWMEAIQRSLHLFVTQWDPNSLKALGLDFFLLLVGWRSLSGEMAGWCKAAAVGLMLGVGASLLLVDGLGLVLPISLQTWRVQWLAHWIAIAALAALLFRDLRARDTGRALLLALTAHLAWGETALGWLVMAALYLTWPHLVAAPRARLRAPLAFVFGLMLAFLLTSHISNEFHWFAEAGYRLDAYAFDLRVLVLPTVALGLPLLGLRLWDRGGNVPRTLLFAVVLVPILVLAAWRWDSRTDTIRQFEAAAFRPDIFGVQLPPGAQVFWEPESLVGAWLVMQRPSYFSGSQLAGQMFNRDTFETGKARRTRMTPLMEEGARCRRDARVAESGDCRISHDSLIAACGPGATPPPDYLVLGYDTGLQAAGLWQLASATGGQALRYKLHSCADVMRELAAPVTLPVDAQDS